MIDESLSALMDGECGPAELDSLLRELDRNPALRARFDRMCRARDLRQGARAVRVPTDFADRVFASLGRATPNAARAEEPARPVWQPLAALALAASIAAVAVLVLQPDLPEPAEPARAAAGAPVAAALPAEIEAVAAPVALTVEALRDRQLRNYLMAYSQSRAQHGMGGTLGYARFAAHSGTAAPGSER